MRWPVIVVLLQIAASATAATAATAATRELLQAVRVGSAIWLLREGGELARLDDDAPAAVPVTLPARAISICRTGESLVVTAAGKTDWQILQPRGAGWQIVSRTARQTGEVYIGTACASSGVTIMTDRRLIDRQHGTVRLTGYTPGMTIRTTLYREPDALLVGTNAGEWGGKLMRVSFATGMVTEIEGTGAPVHDIAAAPGKPGCVILAIGLVHFFPSGKLTKVCGTTARRLYARPWQPPGVRSIPLEPDKDPYPSVAFYSLSAAANGTLLAVAMDGLYRIARDGAVTGPESLPNFESRGEDHIVHAAPDLDLMLTGINSRASVGGAMTIAVPR